jgi:hypothetical protein
MARRIGDPLIETRLASLRWASWRPDNVGERRALGREIVALASRLAHRELELLGHAFQVADALELGEIAVADSEISVFNRLALDLRQPRYAWWTSMFRTMRALLAGDFPAGERFAHETLAIGQLAQARRRANVWRAHVHPA